MELTSPLLIGLAVLGSLLGGLLVGLRGRGRVTEELQLVRRQLHQQTQTHEAQAEQHRRAVAGMRAEMDTVASLALVLPYIVRDLNRDDLDPREVPRMILQLAKAIFQPTHMLLYGVRSGEGGRGGELYLAQAEGLAEIPRPLKQVPFGEGKIGWVARNGLDMLAEDWDNLTREGIKVATNHPGVRLDIVGPLVHHARDNQTLLGVLCIGAPRIRPKDQKLMFQLVTNLGSLALVNARNISRLRSLVNHDGLTGLLNRRYFTQKLVPATMVTCEREARPLAMFIFDIDHFKNFNDTNGHPAGDDLLRAMARLLRQSLRPGDVACRYGGEEFLVAMPETDREGGLVQAERIRETIATTRFPHGEKQPMGRVTISGGVAAFPKDGTSVAELIQHADEALYQSKRAGRNRVIAYRGVEIGDFSADAVIAVGGDAERG